MIKDEIQKQESGNNSSNIQGKSIIINQGISYSDAKEIALDVYRANFEKLSQDAANVERERAEELTDNFLNRLKGEHEKAISEMQHPGMQLALFEAQKQYARAGDKNLEQMLIDILIERTLTPNRGTHQIVIDESLKVVSKLTVNHLDSMTINYLLIRALFNLVSKTDVLEFFELSLKPFCKNLDKDNTCYEHLEYAKCGSIMRVARWPSLKEIFENRLSNISNSINPDRVSIEEFFSKIETFTKINDVWENSQISRFDLTNVGTYISTVNYKRITEKPINTCPPIVKPYITMG